MRKKSLLTPYPLPLSYHPTKPTSTSIYPTILATIETINITPNEAKTLQKCPSPSPPHPPQTKTPSSNPHRILNFSLFMLHRDRLMGYHGVVIVGVLNRLYRRNWVGRLGMGVREGGRVLGLLWLGVRLSMCFSTFFQRLLLLLFLV